MKSQFAVVFSELDKAGMNVYENLSKMEIPENLILYKTKKESVRLENLDDEVEADFFIFATKHSGSSGVKSFCVHAPGNFSDNSLGGSNGKLSVSASGLMKAALRSLIERCESFPGFEVEIEATHHGPLMNKPSMFIEIGSSEKEWVNKEAGKIIAETILYAVKFEDKWKDSVSCVVLGGGHYNKVAKKIMLNDEFNYSVGHVCPKHCLEFVNEDILKQMIERNEKKSELVVLDWKGLGKEKNKILKLLDNLKVSYKRYQQIS